MLSVDRLLVFCLIAFLALVASSEASESNSESGSESESASESASAGVRLVSWRWHEYDRILGTLLLLLLAGLLKVLISHSRWLSGLLPESCSLIIVGIFLGVILSWADNAHRLPNFTPDLFFHVLLPPIVLDAAYTLYDRNFLTNLFSTLLFAVVGTLFNIFGLAISLLLINRMGLMGNLPTEPTLINLLIFGSFVAAVDPVAVLAIFEEIGVHIELYFLVFGESLLNDGVTVVVYNTMLSLLPLQNGIPFDQIVLAILSFFTVTLGGWGVGLSVGMLSSYVLKFSHPVPVIEPFLVFTSAWLAYFLAETLGWSGIISLIECGVIQKLYTFPNVSATSKTTLKNATKTMASYSESLIFLFLGVVTITDHELEWHLLFTLWTLVLILVLRFLSVFALSAMVNVVRVNKIAMKEQFVLAYGGLRGAVGFSLANIVPKSNELRSVFLATMLAVIFFTVFLQGATIKMVVDKLGIKRGEKRAATLNTLISDNNIDHLMAGVESIMGRRSRYQILEYLRYLDAKLIRPALVRSDVQNRLASRADKIDIKEHDERVRRRSIVDSNQPSFSNEPNVSNELDVSCSPVQIERGCSSKNETESHKGVTKATFEIVDS